MSAYVCDMPTFHILVRAGIRYGLIARASADLVGQALLAENIASVTYRYDGDLLGGQLPGPIDLPHPIVFVPVHLPTAEIPIPPVSNRAYLRPGTYRYEPRAEGEPRLDPAKVLQVIAGYNYQSCEHREWQESAAFAFTHGLARRIYARHPGVEANNAVECWNPSTIAAVHEVR